MLTITGRGPVNLTGGRYTTPPNSSPSKLFHFTSSGSGSVSGLNTADSLLVPGTAAPGAARTETRSPNKLAPANVNAVSELSGRHDGRPRICPFGSFGVIR